MGVMQEIDNRWMECRKSNVTNLAILLGDIRSDAQKLAKENKEALSDKHYQKVIDSQLKSMRDAMAVCDRSTKAYLELGMKVIYLEIWETKTLSHQKTYDLVKSIFESGKTNIGAIMKELKATGKPIDMKMAKEIIDEVLK